MTVRPASTVLALRPAPAGMEVLMVRRAGASVFMGGAYVFPGGAIDAADRAAAAAGADPDELAWRVAGLRELAEEAGVLVTDPDPTSGLADRCADLAGEALYAALAAAGHRFATERLSLVSSWVTPPGPPRRFDTRFYLAGVAAGTPARPDGHEVTEARWVTPAQALARSRAGDWHVPFPTLRHLELLAGFPSVDEAVAHARSQASVPRIAPRLVRTPDGPQVLMPGEPGYEAAEA